MNIVDPRKDILRFARRARARQGFVRSVDVALRTLFYALCAALAGLVAVKLFGVMVPVLPATIALGSVILLAGLIALFFPRINLIEAAAAVDDRAGWKERLSSALCISTPDHPMEFALLDDVRGKLRQHSASELFPFRAPRELRYSPLVAIAIAACAFFVPQVDLLGFVARDAEKKKEKEEIALVVEKLEKRRKELEKNDRAMDKVKDAIKKIDALAAELQKNPPPERKEALAQISKLSEELEKMKAELSKSQALADKLQKAAAEKGGDSGELGRLMREGKFQEAVQELAKMRNKLQEGKMTDAEREKLRKQMDELAKKMAKDKELNEFEKKLAEAMKGLEMGDEKMLDGLQQALGDVESDLNEAEALAEALKDLENLSDALAKGHKKCPNCGKEKEKGEGG